jgi:hypothetical protein
MANGNNGSSGEGAGKAPNLKRYETDVSGVSLKNLETGLWWVKNRGNLKKALIVFLSLICISTVGYSLFGFGMYFFKGMWDDKRMATELVNTTTVSPEFLEQRSAKDLALSGVSLLDNDGRYDMYVNMQNPNPRHWGMFSYCFSSGEKNLKCGDDFILPGEKKILAALGIESDSRPSNIKFILNAVNWKKLNAHSIPDWNTYRTQHLKLDIGNVSFKPASASELSEKIDLNSLSFSVKNESAYGYWEAPLTIVLYRSNRIVGISRYTLKEFSSYDMRDVKLTWPGDLSGVNDVDILPDINVMDENNYLPPGR